MHLNNFNICAARWFSCLAASTSSLYSILHILTFGLLFIRRGNPTIQHSIHFSNWILNNIMCLMFYFYQMCVNFDKCANISQLNKFKVSTAPAGFDGDQITMKPAAPECVWLQNITEQTFFKCSHVQFTPCGEQNVSKKRTRKQNTIYIRN